MNTCINIPIKCRTADKDFPALESWEARITYFKNYGSHYEMRIQAYYGAILVLFGKTAFGYFVCIPDFEAGCYLSHLKDIFWNTEALVRTIDEITGITIAEALRAIVDLIEIQR
ncbi:MAG: hypothetical protein KGZ81_06075 [Flavobacteriales bacterium]|nr:hypothetical protein [Flavobacteriales bacterium]